MSKAAPDDFNITKGIHISLVFFMFDAIHYTTVQQDLLKTFA